MPHKRNHIKRRAPASWAIPLGFFALGLIAKFYNEAHPIAIESDTCLTGVPVTRTINPFLLHLLKFEGSFHRPDTGKFSVSTVPLTMKVKVTGEGKYINTIDFGDGITDITLEAKDDKGIVIESLRVAPTVLNFMFGLQMRSLTFEHICIPPEPQAKIPPNRELRSYAAHIPYANRSYGLPRRTKER